MEARQDNLATAEKRAAFEQARLQMEELRVRFRAYRGKVQTTERSMQAAQAEADNAREQWRDKLRESDGVITKDVQRLRADERAAYTLIEEYQSIHEEMQRTLAGMQLELAEAAKTCISTREGLATAMFEDALVEVVERCGVDIRRVMALHREANRIENPRSSPLWTDDESMIHGRFFHRLSAALKGLDADDDLPQALSLDLADVDMVLVGSHAARHRQRVELGIAS